jgi:hypothetical protein
MDATKGLVSTRGGTIRRAQRPLQTITERFGRSHRVGQPLPPREGVGVSP